MKIYINEEKFIKFHFFQKYAIPKTEAESYFSKSSGTTSEKKKKGYELIVYPIQNAFTTFTTKKRFAKV